MKILLPISLLLFMVSCGKSESLTSGIGAIVTYNPVVVSDTTKSMVTDICAALDEKETRYRSAYLNGAKIFTFRTSKVDCEGRGGADTTVTAILRDSGRLYYDPNSGGIVPVQVETKTYGMISALCTQLAAGPLTSPFLTTTSGTTMMSFTVQDCSSGGQNVACLSINTGSKQNDGSYVIGAVDGFAVVMSSGYSRGNISQQVHQDLYSCGIGKKTTTTTNLLSIQ